MKNTIKKFLRKTPYSVIANRTLEFSKYDFVSVLRKNFSTFNSFENSILKKMIFYMLDDLSQKVTNSKSQLGQDYLAQSLLGDAKSGFFIEIGGGDPIIASNSYLLQNSFNWTGIIVEPNPKLIQKTMEIRCQSGKVFVYPFALSRVNGWENFLPSGMLGTFERYIDGDFHSKQRNKLKNSQKMIKVATKTPTTFIKDCKITNVDFLSIDTEGSEWEIIANWPFNLIQPKVICIEVNNRGHKDEILRFLEGKNYVNILRKISKYDLWFVVNQDAI